MKADWDDIWTRQRLVVPDREPAFEILSSLLLRGRTSFKGLRSVELGAGRGDISFMLARMGARVTLVDTSRVALAQARTLFTSMRLDATFLEMDIEEAASTLGRFDLAMSYGLVEHFTGAERSDVFRAHRVGREVFIGVPNAFCIPYRLTKFVLERTRRWRFGQEVPSTKPELLEEMAREFGSVRVFTIPMSYSLSKLTGRASYFRTPLDPLMGYQLLAYGVSR